MENNSEDFFQLIPETERIFYADCWYVVDYLFRSFEEGVKFKAFKIRRIDLENVTDSEFFPNPDLWGRITWEIIPEINCCTEWKNVEYREQFNKVLDYIIAKAEKHFDSEF